MILTEFEGHFCCYEWQNAPCSPSATAELCFLWHIAAAFCQLSLMKG